MYYSADVAVARSMDTQNLLPISFQPVSSDVNLEMQDPTNQILPNSQWWSTQSIMPLADNFIDPFTNELNHPRTDSVSQYDETSPTEIWTPGTGSPGKPEWQEKVRAERRKVQNRAAQRAYRERKEKALQELRELLDVKEEQFQNLQKDHKLLQEQYQKLLGMKNESSPLPVTAASCPEELFSTNSETKPGPG